MPAKRCHLNVPDEGLSFISLMSVCFLLTNNSDPMTTATMVVTTVKMAITRATVIHANCTSADGGQDVDKATLLSLSKAVPGKVKDNRTNHYIYPRQCSPLIELHVYITYQ